ncbi:MAG: hypothetical protein E4H40_03585, partial [Candidatus Brocadiia bacterium]
MSVKDIWSKTSGWVRSRRIGRGGGFRPMMDENGRTRADNEVYKDHTGQESADEQAKKEDEKGVENHVVVKQAQQMDKQETLERLQQGFNTLIEQLRDINNNLARQADRNEALMQKFDEVPELLKRIPEILDSNKELTEKFYEQARSNAAREAVLIEAVEKIPVATARQTDKLVEINHQLTAAAESEALMAEGFNKFNEMLSKLNENTGSQADSIHQMNKTFSTSDRYTKYIMARQHKRFVWLFFISLGFCLTVILIM